ncbi:hypothetical protein HDV00_003545 [Rhizophlyctis rosea]|nr:hypothetical protein HDV00_003545 [Rhizophlyctis rosea]
MSTTTATQGSQLDIPLEAAGGSSSNGARRHSDYIVEDVPPSSVFAEDSEGHPLMQDPMQLRQRKKDDQQLSELRRRGKKSKDVVDFYKKQNELIDDLLTPPGDVAEGEEARLVKLKIAVYGSFAANICLFIFQLVAAIVSGSLSLFATTADAFMACNRVLRDNLLSPLLIMEAIAQDWMRFPAGKKRMETAGIIVFSVLMATLSLQLMIEAVRTLINQTHDLDLSILSICLVAAALQHIQYIVGKSADPDLLQKLTYISVTHDDRIQQIDTCRAYHAGENFFVEVDIVLPADMTVRDSHDIAEALQIKLESLQNVERAFVHIDYETSHKPEHRVYDS